MHSMSSRPPRHPGAPRRHPPGHRRYPPAAPSHTRSSVTAQWALGLAVAGLVICWLPFLGFLPAVFALTLSSVARRLDRGQLGEATVTARSATKVAVFALFLC